ncbi:MAG: hypothetical protein QOF66_318 [Mycobacterium sp.]|uniref:hypothetical protein n=1 Tax=Mycobacterium sp. TaxID=1785 RepID=UPI0028B8BA3D|nr:hypothetical protein [Mycobacterium sp.]
MQYFSDGGPGPATKLLRVDYDGPLDDMDSIHPFGDSKAERWSPRDGWQPSPTATSDILWSGWLSRISESEVPTVEDQLRARAATRT